MVDDRWRALSGFVRKLSSDDCSKDNKFCARCYIRACAASGVSIPFFEYRWAYFFNDAYLHQDLFNKPANAAAFSRAFDALPSAPPGGAAIDDWAAVAKLLSPVCRGATAGPYSVPSTMGMFTGRLPGYHSGNAPIEEPDPDCDFPSCPQPTVLY